MLDAFGQPILDENGQPMYENDTEEGSWVDGEWVEDHSEAEDEDQSGEEDDEEDVSSTYHCPICLLILDLGTRT
jgi:hypothetical protein